MSRRNNDVEDFVGFLFKIILVPIVWLLFWIVEKLKTPLAVQFRKLDAERPQLWGGTIGEVHCRRCNAINESNRHSCFQCGIKLVAESEPFVIDEAKKKRDRIIAVVILVAFLSIWILMIVLSDANIQW